MSGDPGQFIDAEVIKTRLAAIEAKVDQLTGRVEALQAALERAMKLPAGYSLNTERIP